MMRMARNFTIGLVFGIILTFEVLWNAETAALARECARRNLRPAH